MLTTSKNKILSVFGLAMINVIAIDSLRNLPINAEYGLSIIPFYLIGAIVFFLPCIIITSRLAVKYPKNGGSYIWVREAFGARFGFMNTWLQWIYNLVWFPTILSFIAASISYLIAPELVSNKAYMLSMILGLFTLATLVNCFGMKLASSISNLGAIIGTIVPMVFIMILGAAWLGSGKPLAIPMDSSALIPKISSINNLAFLVVILFSLIGIEMSSVHAGDVKNPEKDYPRALWLSAAFILISMILASVAVAIILPKADINIVGGLNQAFNNFLNSFNLGFLMPAAVLSIIIGGFTGMAAWVLGPTKALMVAANDGAAPQFFAKTNRYGAPLGVLLLQLAIMVALCSLFLLFKSVSTTYWVLSDLTAQLALIYYILLFTAAIKLLSKSKKIWLAGIVGTLTCIIAIILGFLPPNDVTISSIGRYEWSLSIGVFVFTIAPLVIYQVNTNKKSPNSK